MNQSKTVALVAISLLALIFIIYKVVGRSNSNSPSDLAPYKIGATLALTGPYAYLGEAERNGLTLAVEEINNDGGVEGHKLELIVEDNQGDAKVAVTTANKLFDVDQVPIIFSAFTHITNAIKAKVAQEGKILLYASTFRDIASENSLFFRDYFDAADSGTKAAEYSIQKNYSTMGFFTEISEPCQSFEKGFTDKAEQSGLQILFKESFSSTDKDFRTQLTKLKSRSMDALLVCSWRNEDTFMKQLKELGMINLPTLHFVAPFLPNAQTGEINQLFAENKTISTWYGVMGTDSDFARKYQTRFNAKASPDAQFAYDDIYILRAALKQCQNDNPECLKTQLQKIEHTGVSQKLKFDESRLINRNVNIIEFSGTSWH